MKGGGNTHYKQIYFLMKEGETPLFCLQFRYTKYIYNL